MKFVCRSASTGKLIKTASGFRSALYRANTGYILFLPTMAGSQATLEVMVYRGGSSSFAGFSLMNMWTSEITQYNIVNPSSSYGTNAEYMWYVAKKDDSNTIQLSYGYPNNIKATATAPEITFQTAADDSGNLYMASGSADASDWKQINNAPASVTYYLQKQSTAGMSGVSTYIYTDANRTIPAAPATLVSDFKAGKTILLEYEQTDAATPYSITFQVNSASADGDPTVSCQYKLLISELNKDTGTYNAVTTQLSATVTAGTEFTGKWTTVRAVLPTVNNGALTIQQNGTTLDTFTANSSDDKTVNIQTITAETVAPAEEVGAITASMIDWSTIVMKGTWTTTQALSSIGASTQVTIDISSLGLSAADDYVVTVTNRMISSNSWATALVVTDRTASSFTIKLFNSHWSGGTVGAGNIIDWAVFKVV